MYKRSEKVAEAIHEEVSALLVKGIKDPRVGFVTVTAAKVTDDLSLATIFFTVIGNDEEKKAAEVGLNSAKGFIRRELGKIMRLRHVPDLVFRYDKSLDYGNRIDGLLRQIKSMEDEHAAEDH
jgi:ribosome-binding factor A